MDPVTGIQDAVTPARVIIEAERRALGAKLAADFTTYEQDRRAAEQQWMKNLRQFLGVYDDDIKAQLTNDRSQAYPKLTRVKVVSMVSRLMNMMFPSNERNWAVEASPVPNLSEDDLRQVLDAMPQDEGVTDETITMAVREFAKLRARNLELEIEDQLSEVGGTRTVNYVALCKRVVMSGVMYGAGVLKGPATRKRNQTRWVISNGVVQPTTESIVVPHFEFCPLWDYYPDMSAKYPHQMDGQFQRMVMSRQQVRRLADDSMFFKDVLLKYLETHAEGNYKQKSHESELKSLGVHDKRPANDGRKYEIIVWDGALSAKYLRGVGVTLPADSKESDVFNAVVWMIGAEVIRAELNAWTMLGEDPIPSYHLFIFEEDESNLLGNGLPQIMRDSALAVAATARMVLDNGSVVCGPMTEVNTALLSAGQDRQTITAYQVFERDDDSPSTAQIPAVRSINIDSHIDELLRINETFRGFADQETFVGPATGGDLQKGPSEPFRTAAGASMLRGDAALPFKDVVRQFDMFTESVIGALVTFNKHFNTKASLRGDFQAVAKGSTSLIAKEVRGIAIDQISQTITPEERLYIDARKMLRERLRSRDVDLDVMVSDAVAEQREKAQAQRQQEEAERAAEFMRATIRKTLADAVKSLSQSDKNAAGAQVAVYNAILAGLEKGASPAEVADVRAGGEHPTGVVDIRNAETQPTKEAA